ncbi:hypothetical protein [Nocardia sp. No.11]|uniref:hypothetical protein n=1 Tax=Nocardia sp. No.11 TaxID=3128861 RepID=UPI00319E5AC1
MEHIAARVGASVLAALEDADVSLRRAADESGIALVTLSRKCNGLGTRTFDVLELYRLAKVIGRPVSELLPEDLRA